MSEKHAAEGQPCASCHRAGEGCSCKTCEAEQAAEFKCQTCKSPVDEATYMAQHRHLYGDCLDCARDHLAELRHSVDCLDSRIRRVEGA
jgi:hypothetical protein